MPRLTDEEREDRECEAARGRLRDWRKSEWVRKLAQVTVATKKEQR